MSHYEERLTHDLDEIRGAVRDLAGFVERALKDAMHALLDGDTQLANMTVLRDSRINRASRSLDHLCHAFIARHLPGAGHLRLISAVIRINVALERIGDYAVTISRESLQLSTPPSGRLARELDRVASESQIVLHQAIAAFDAANADAAAATIPISENIENTMDDIYAELTGAGSQRSPREIVAAFVVFSLLKRISDQGKNICEQTLFAVAGWSKKTKRLRVLFIDGGNNERSLIAQGVARKSYADVASYFSASPQPAPAPDAEMLRFLESCGIETKYLSVDRLRPGQHELQEMDVIISLDAPVSHYVEHVPFHSSAIHWDIDADLKEAGASGDTNKVLYRVLRQRIDQLVELISGTSTDD